MQAKVAPLMRQASYANCFIFENLHSDVAIFTPSAEFLDVQDKLKNFNVCSVIYYKEILVGEKELKGKTLASKLFVLQHTGHNEHKRENDTHAHLPEWVPLV